jgi:hypothetical protein
LALLLDLSDNFLKSAQFNIIISSQEKMDWVGVEPTSSAMPNIDRKKVCSNLTPVQSTTCIR